MRDCPALQDVQQFLATHGGESIAADGHRLSVDHDVDVVPIREGLTHVIEGRAIGGLDAAQGLVTEHHAESESVVGSIALPHGDLRRRVELLDQAGEVEPARAGTDDRNAHEISTSSRH